MKRNNRGFSLVELIVVIAILSFVGLGVVSFLSTSLNTYKSVSQNVDVQEEAQMALSQIVTMLQNAEMGVTGTDRSGDDYLYIYNEDYRYAIAKSGDELVYLKQDKKAKEDGSGFTFDDVSTVDASDFSLLAENVENFSAQNVTSADSSQTVILLSIDLKKSDGSAAYSASQNVALRNTVLVNPSDYKDVYGTPDAPIQKTTYSNITVSINNPGGVETEFSYSPSSTSAVYVPIYSSTTTATELSYSVIVSYSGPNPDPSYDAAITGSLSANSSFDPDNRKIYIGKDQTTDLGLNIKLRKEASMQVTVPIKIVRVGGIAINQGSAVSGDFKDLCYAGNSISLGSDAGLVASVTGNNIEASTEWTKVKWKVEILDSTETSVEYTEDDVTNFLIPDDASYTGKKIRFTAASVFDGAWSTSVTYTILAAHNKINLSVSKAEINRGETITFSITDESGNSYESKPGYSSDDLDYILTIKNSATNEELADKTGIKVKKSELEIKASADNDKLDYNTAYTVSLSVKDTKLNVESNMVTFTVPAVTVTFNPATVVLYTDYDETKWSGFWPYYTITYYKTVNYEVSSGIIMSAITDVEMSLSKKTSTNVIYVDTDSFSTATNEGTFKFHKEYSTDNLNRTCNVKINGNVINSDTLNIFGSTVPAHTLRIVLDKTTVNRGGSVGVHVFSKDIATGIETEITDLSTLTWTYYVDGSEKSGNLRSGNTIELWSSDDRISYNKEHTFTVGVSDGIVSCEASATVPKVTVEYSENPIYLCSGNYPQDKNGKHKATITYQIVGLENAKITKFSNSTNNVKFEFENGTFTVECKNNSKTINFSGNAYVNDKEIKDSTFSVYSKASSNIININGINYEIEPKETRYWTKSSDGKIAYYVEKDDGVIRCWIYIYSADVYYCYDYVDESWTYQGFYYD